MNLKRGVLALSIASAILAYTGTACATTVHVEPQPASGSVQGYHSTKSGLVDATPASKQAADQTASNAKSIKTKQTAKQKAEERAKQKQQNATNLGAITVTGFAASLQNSINIKRDSNSIVEAVSAEQMGKLPGTSIASSLGRLPGLATQLVAGRPSVLSIHGLGPDFSTALINGNEQASTANNRDVQFDQYPSSWFGSVVVHLTPSADLLGQGLAGTVNLHTIRPLDESNERIALHARYFRNGRSQLSPGGGVHNYGGEFDGVYVNQFANHTFGVTFGVDIDENPRQIEHQQQGLSNYALGPDNEVLTGTPTNPVNPNAWVVNDSKDYAFSDMLKRNSVLLTLQWQPNSHVSSTLDMTYSKFKETQQAKGIEFSLFGSSKETETATQITNGVVTAGVANNVYAVIRNDHNQDRDSVWNLDWQTHIHINAGWSARVGANYSRAEKSADLLESYSGGGYAKTGPYANISFRELSDGMLYWQPQFVPSSFSYGSNQVVLTDPQGWGAGGTPPVVQAGFLNSPSTNDYIEGLHFRVTHYFEEGPLSSVEFGAEHKVRNKSYFLGQDFILPANGAEELPLPADARGADIFGWQGLGPQDIYNPFAVIASGKEVYFPTVLSSIAVPPNWHVHERDLVSYVQANIDTQLGNVTLRGNFGVQFIHTDQTSTGKSVSLANETGPAGANINKIVLTPVSGGTNYNMWLPSFNLVFGLTNNDVLRLSAAKTMARPRLDQMSVSSGLTGNIHNLTNTNPNLSFFSASGGNPTLKPTRADNYNVSYEHYFHTNNGGSSGFNCSIGSGKTSSLCRAGAGSTGFVALSAYFLSLENYIDPNAAFLRNFSQFIPLYLSTAEQARLGTPLGIVSGPKNDGHGFVKGLQGSLNLPFAFIARPLRDFGLLASVDLTKSSVILGTNPAPITLPGLSERVTNVTLYFQSHGFQARINRTDRASFLGRVAGISATRVTQYIKGGPMYSAQVSYTVGSGTLRGLSIIAQGSNLSDHKFVTYQNNNPVAVQQWESFGRTYTLGVSYQF